MYDSQPLRDMRMRIALTRNPVCRPACMGNPGTAMRRRALRLRRQLGDTADRAQTLQARTVDDGQSGRIVATIFKTTQSFEQDGNDVAVSNRCDNATHGLFPE